jgi:hypothetical protein
MLPIRFDMRICGSLNYPKFVQSIVRLNVVKEPVWLPSIWTFAAALVGIAFGSWLTVKNQRKQWLLDNKRAEYRKLLTTIADAGSRLVVHYGMNLVADFF